jgi:nitrate reductase delta subunit
MSFDRQVYDALSRLIGYPSPGYCEAAEEWASVVAKESPAAGEALKPFIGLLAERTGEQMEELYASTFDNSQSAALELGWHVFGETYDRGAFLVRMRGMLREHGIEEGIELPDHLRLVLALLARCPEEVALMLAVEAVEPSVRKISVSLAAGDNPYESVMDAVLAILELHQTEVNRCN